MNRKITAIIFFFTILSSIVNAQPYNSAFGVRLGLGVGLTYKGFVSPNAAIEGIAQYAWKEHGYGLCGLYEFHNYHSFRTSNLALMYGFGAHVAYYNKGFYKNRSGIYYVDSAMNFGLDGIIGIDYYIPEARIDWSLDVKPFLDFVNPGFRFWDGAVSVRYTF